MNLAIVKRIVGEVMSAKETFRGGNFDAYAETIIKRNLAKYGDKPLEPVDTDASMNRTYYPLPGGWEIQTKGKGSSFRICNTVTGDRWLVADTFLHAPLEQMAKDIRQAYETGE